MDLARLAAGPRSLSARSISSAGSRPNLLSSCVNCFNCSNCPSCTVVPTRSMSSAEPKPGADAPTHTGQSWEDNDLRSVRFSVTGAQKQVNDQWAQDLIQEVPIKMVATRIVGCDGGGGALGHPKVYINLDDGEPHGCIYCGLRFQLDPKAAAAAH